MLFRSDFLDALKAGRVDLAFRRWARARVKAGTRLRTSIGVVEVVQVEVVALASIDERDAVRAGFTSPAALRRALEAKAGRVHRVVLAWAGPDPRIALRARGRLRANEASEIHERLARLDAASRRGPWTAAVLDLIADHPGVRAGDLAPALGRELRAFKRDVRKLKELGLTESLEVGYRLSPRGRAFLARRR